MKIVAFLATILPALWIAYQGWTGELGARPVTEAIHQAGDWALRFLFITLAITPAQRILNYPAHHAGDGAHSASPPPATRCCICRSTSSISISICSRWQARSSCASTC